MSGRIFFYGCFILMISALSAIIMSNFSAINFRKQLNGERIFVHKMADIDSHLNRNYAKMRNASFATLDGSNLSILQTAFGIWNQSEDDQKLNRAAQQSYLEPGVTKKNKFKIQNPKKKVSSRAQVDGLQKNVSLLSNGSYKEIENDVQTRNNYSLRMGIKAGCISARKFRPSAKRENFDTAATVWAYHSHDNKSNSNFML